MVEKDKSSKQAEKGEIIEKKQKPEELKKSKLPDFEFTPPPPPPPPQQIKENNSNGEE